MKNEFEKSVEQEKPCPKCKSYVIHLYGGGWDYDRKYCSDKACDYEVEYETTTAQSDRPKS